MGTGLWELYMYSARVSPAKRKTPEYYSHSDGNSSVSDTVDKRDYVNIGAAQQNILGSNLMMVK